MKLLNEFKDFAMKGNVVDMAVGVIIGGAFGKIVSSLVADVFMPIVSLAVGGIDFKNLFVALDGNTYKTLAEAQEAGAATLSCGNFLQTVFDFLIVAICIFAFIKLINSFKKKEEEAPAAPTTKKCPYCFEEIPIEATRCPHCTSELPKDEK